jgi:hypothetical protein
MPLINPTFRFPVEKESPPSISDRPTRQRRLPDRLFPVDGSNNDSLSLSDIDEEIDEEFQSLPPSHKPSPRIIIQGSCITFKDVSGYIPPSPDTIDVPIKMVPSRSKRKTFSGPLSPVMRRHLPLPMKPGERSPLQPIRSSPTKWRVSSMWREWI